MASRSALLALLVAVSCAAAASATSFTVGDGQGWKIGPDYSTWASGQTFNEGDELVFNFAANSHDVAVVDKSGYDSCSAGSSNTINNNSPATIKLTAGTHYYICTFPSHCSSGMKLAVTVGSGSGTPSPSTPSTPGAPPTTPSPTTPSGPSPNSASARFTAAPALAVAAGVLVKLALF